MHVIYRDRTWDFDEAMTVKQLLKRLELLPEAVLVVREGTLLTEDQTVHPGETIKIVAVISGG